MSASTTRQPTKASRGRRGEPQQLDLFGANRLRPTSDVPTWSVLPAEARSALIGLMRRLILEHVDRKQQSDAVRASHDL